MERFIILFSVLLSIAAQSRVSSSHRHPHHHHVASEENRSTLSKPCLDILNCSSASGDLSSGFCADCGHVMVDPCIAAKAFMTSHARHEKDDHHDTDDDSAYVITATPTGPNRKRFLKSPGSIINPPNAAASLLPLSLPPPHDALRSCMTTTTRRTRRMVDDDDDTGRSYRVKVLQVQACPFYEEEEGVRRSVWGYRVVMTRDQMVVTEAQLVAALTTGDVEIVRGGGGNMPGHYNWLKGDYTCSVISCDHDVSSSSSASSSSSPSWWSFSWSSTSFAPTSPPWFVKIWYGVGDLFRKFSSSV